MSENATGPDEALVESLLPLIHLPTDDPWTKHEKSAYHHAGGWREGFEAARRVRTRAVLAHVADQLIPADAEEREEWGRRWPSGDENVLGADEAVARLMTSRSVVLLRRTVRTWATPDGSAGTLVGPWVEVEG
jgi:hypothetical protein